MNILSNVNATLLVYFSTLNLVILVHDIPLFGLCDLGVAAHNMSKLYFATHILTDFYLIQA